MHINAGKYLVLYSHFSKSLNNYSTFFCFKQSVPCVFLDICRLSW